MTPRIGVLALQGGFAAHLAALRRAGSGGREVRDPRLLDDLEALILPGGESTTHLKLMAERGFPPALRAFAARGGAIFGTCAGAILLARRVLDPDQPGLGLVDIDIRRNAYGRQIDSFETSCATHDFGGGPLDLVFIRAPRIVRIGPGVESLARLDGEPLLVRQGRILAGTFHPELSPDPRVHRYFVEMALGAPVTAS
jgi:5'-phosphate synthase pdxT subunit